MDLQRGGGGLQRGGDYKGTLGMDKSGVRLRGQCGAMGPAVERVGGGGRFGPASHAPHKPRQRSGPARPRGPSTAQRRKTASGLCDLCTGCHSTAGPTVAGGWLGAALAGTLAHDEGVSPTPGIEPGVRTLDLEHSEAAALLLSARRVKTSNRGI